MNTEPSATPHKCANPQCKVFETGRCLEGLEFDKCSTYGRDPEIDATPETTIVTEPTSTLINLRPATTLSVSRASELLGRQDGRVVAIVGPRDAGKTSLIAGLFDLFQVGPVAEISFAGSETLHAFELACHDSRAASRRAVPSQPHTGLGDVSFYHLNLRYGSAEAGITLLLGDRAGEEYLTAADDLSQAGPFLEVSRADTVTLLLDGSRLLNNQTRHNTRSETGLMVRALADGEFLERKPHIIFALTKMDLVNASQHKNRAIADFDKVVELATEILTPHAQSFMSIHLAAAPADTSMDRGSGVDELLQSWARPCTQDRHATRTSVPATRSIQNVRMPTKKTGTAT